MDHGTATYGPATEDVHAEVDMQRVKVYRLNAEGTWDDRGTGLITLQHLEQSGAMGLVVCEEAAPHKPLLIHRLSRDNIYTQQGGSANDDTIILWTDAEAQTDIAISFQEADGCKHMWSQIQMEQARAKGNRGLRRPLVDEMEPSAATQEDGLQEAPISTGPIELPPPDMRNLDQIAKIMVELMGPQKEQVASQMLQNNYLRKILNVFRSCEDLEDTDSLRSLFDIVKCAIMLNDTNILEALFSEENVMDVVGALEHDPELLEPQRYREFLKDTVVFKEVVPFRNPAVKAKVHQTYRIGYVKDVILPRVLDDATLATLSSLMMFNNVEVVLALMDEPGFLPDLFQKFREAELGSEAWSDIVGFLQEMASLGKCLQQGHRTAMLSKLIQLGLFEAMTQVLEHGDQRLQLKATDVLISVVLHDPVPLREDLLREASTKDGRRQEDRQNPLFRHLMRLLTSGAGGGLQEQVTEILRALLDPESMIQDSEKSDFLQKFYDVYIDQLMTVIEAGTDKSLKSGSGPSPSALGLIVEILCFCVQHHGYRIKYYVLTHGVMEKVLKLLHRREKWLVVAAIRFIRTCLGVKDEFYHRHIEKVNLFEPIVTVFVANGERYNLLNSVVLEMIDFVRKENLKILIRHFVEKHYARIEDVDYDDTFVKLKDKYEQMLDNSRGSAPAAASAQLHANRIRKDERALDRDEEEYFGEGDDEEEGPPPPASSRHSNGAIEGLQMEFPLVDYADDDEDTDPSTSPGFKRNLVPANDNHQQDKKPRFIDRGESQGFPIASPQLLQPGNESVGWRHG